MLGAQALTQQGITLLSFQELCKRGASAPVPPAAMQRTDLWGIIYSSGTTGDAKARLQTAAATCAGWESRKLSLSDELAWALELKG